MSQALRTQERLVIPRRQAGEASKARPCLGDHASQFEKAGKLSLERYENAYRELAKV